MMRFSTFTIDSSRGMRFDLPSYWEAMKPSGNDKLIFPLRLFKSSFEKILQKIKTHRYIKKL